MHNKALRQYRACSSATSGALPTTRVRHALRCIRLSLTTFPLLCATAPAFAAPAPATLDRVTVKGQSLFHARDQGYSGTLLHGKEIREAGVDQVQELLERVPGVNISNNGLAGVADNISLRGFGNGAHGGDIGFIIDGIPLNEAMSHADGYGDLNVIIPLELARIGVLRGPVSALYGNYNRAGSITLQTRRGGNYRDIDLSVAEYGKVDLQAAAGFEHGGNQRINMAVQGVYDDGFREQSRTDRQTFAGRWAFDVHPDLEIALSTRLHRSEAANASYLPRDLFRRSPYGRHPDVQNDGAEKAYRSVRLDANYQLGSALHLLGFAYHTRQDFTRWFTRPVSGTWTQREESYDRDVSGGGFSLTGHSRALGRHLDWIAGAEVFRESTDFTKFEDTRFRQRTGLPEHDRRFRLHNLAAFGEMEWQLHRLLIPSLGWRWDRLSGDCDLLGSQTSTAECERMHRVTHGSPKLALRSQPLDWLELRGSWAEGFAIAPEVAKYSLRSSQLSPNVFRQTELGLRLAWHTLDLDLVGYRIESSDEIGLSPTGEYENFGETLRRGFEIAGRWDLSASLDMMLAWATAQSEVRRHRDATLIGNRVTGVPGHTTTLALNWQPRPGWESSLRVRDIGDYAIDAGNQQITGDYRTADLTVAYRPPVSTDYRIYLAVENVTDKVYATTVSTLGYAAGAPRRVSVGLQASF